MSNTCGRCCMYCTCLISVIIKASKYFPSRLLGSGWPWVVQQWSVEGTSRSFGRSEFSSWLCSWESLSGVWVPTSAAFRYGQLWICMLVFCFSTCKRAESTHFEGKHIKDYEALQGYIRTRILTSQGMAPNTDFSSFIISKFTWNNFESGQLSWIMPRHRSRFILGQGLFHLQTLPCCGQGGCECRLAQSHCQTSSETVPELFHLLV